MTAKGLNSPRPSWTWAQVAVENRNPYRLILEGSASNGGFAIDDIKFQTQACPSKLQTIFVQIIIIFLMHFYNNN